MLWTKVPKNKPEKKKFNKKTSYITKDKNVNYQENEKKGRECKAQGPSNQVWYFSFTSTLIL